MDDNFIEDIREDKRVFERKDFNSILRFKSDKSDKNGEGIARNISASGMSFITKQKLRPRQELELWIGVPDGRNPVYKTAEVVWAKENLANTYEAGVKFDSVGLMELSRIFKGLQGID